MYYFVGVSDAGYPELVCIDFSLTSIFYSPAEAKIDTEQT